MKTTDITRRAIQIAATAIADSEIMALATEVARKGEAHESRQHAHAAYPVSRLVHRGAADLRNAIARASGLSVVENRGLDAAYELVLTAAQVEEAEREQMRATGSSEDAIARETFGYCSCADPTTRTNNGSHPIHHCRPKEGK